MQEIASSLLTPINGCGDNVATSWPARLSLLQVLRRTSFARAARYFRLPTQSYIEIFEIDPKYLRDDRKTGKIRVRGQAPEQEVQDRDLGVDRDERRAGTSPTTARMRTDDIGSCPVDGGSKAESSRYTSAEPGREGRVPTFATMGSLWDSQWRRGPMKALDAIVATHREWGDRKNRNWARMKYVVYKMGVPGSGSRSRQGRATRDAAGDLDYGGAAAPRLRQAGDRRQVLLRAYIETGG